ncbi:hypothetical protein Tco_0260419 [Tanacetum coccineum]
MQPSFPELDSRLVVLSFNPSDDHIASFNKAMTFLSIAFASCFPQTNNQLRTLFNPRNQATIQDERATVQTEILTPTAFQTDDLDAFDSDYDDVPSAKAVLMGNLSSYDSDVLLEKSKKKEDKYLDKVIDLQKKIKALENVVYKMGQSTQTMHMLTKSQVFYDESHKPTLGYQNPFYLSQARWKVPTLYDGNTIVKTYVAFSVTHIEETLALAEESRLKMLAKQNDLSLKKNKVNLKPVDYVALNKLLEHFAKHFVPRKQLSAEQAYWLHISQSVSEKPLVPSEPVLKKEIPRELPPISLVKDSFHKMKQHVNKFDETITFHTKITGNRIGFWGVEHIKGAFEKDVKPFAQTLKYFQLLEYGVHKELKEMKAVFNQMKTEVSKCSIDNKYFEIEKKELGLDNDRLLEHIIFQDVINVVMHADVHNVLSANNNCLDNDNNALELLKMENDRLIELLISQDLVHTTVNSLAAINDYKSMQQSFVDEYEENLKL